MQSAGRGARSAWLSVYLTLVVVVGASVIVDSLWTQSIQSWPPEALVLVALTLLSGLSTLRMPSVAASFSISDAFTMSAALAFGPGAGTLTVALDSLAISWRLARRQLPARQALFNATAPPLAMWVAAQLFFALAGVDPLSADPTPMARLALPALVFAFAYFGLNTGLIAFAVALEAGLRFRNVWRANFMHLWVSYFAGVLVSAAIVLLVYQRSSAVAVLVVLVPLPVILHTMFKNAMRRAEDQISHLDKVNRLYQSTIESLAQAIDAKDQVTHGHIRRVQAYAARLAVALGVDNDSDLRALQAAALLHDTGKLAIPEYILNKPDKLTAAEFEIMKSHAKVGADILSKVEFPFPVVPIVRHHHENWDGSGYPDGLKAEEIPIGARILSVVDCFDALTSDRPYRRKMSTEDALNILFERRGSMYDAKVVDAFAAAHANGAFLDIDEESGRDDAAPVVPRQIPPTASHATSADAGGETRYRALFDFAQAVVGIDEPARLCDAVWLHLAGASSAATCVVFVHQPESDELIASYVTGVHAESLNGLAIPLGHRLSGWVAANRTSIVNSDAALDLETLVESLTDPPRHCASVPMVTNGQLIGALTVYSSTDRFSEADAAVLRVAAERVAPAVAAATTVLVDRTLTVQPAQRRLAERAAARQ